MVQGTTQWAKSYARTCVCGGLWVDIGGETAGFGSGQIFGAGIGIESIGGIGGIRNIGSIGSIGSIGNIGNMSILGNNNNNVFGSIFGNHGVGIGSSGSSVAGGSRR